MIIIFKTTKNLLIIINKEKSQGFTLTVRQNSVNFNWKLSLKLAFSNTTLNIEYVDFKKGVYFNSP